MSKFVIRKVPTGLKFDLVAANGEPIGNSQVYSSLEACEKGIECVRHIAPEAPLEDQTQAGYKVLNHPKYEMYTDQAGNRRFRLMARNGQEVLASQAYSSKATCEKGIDSVALNAARARVVQAE